MIKLDMHNLKRPVLSALLSLLTIYSLQLQARDFKFKDLYAKPVPSAECTDLLRAHGRLGKVRLQDEEEVIFTSWNVENVVEFQGKFQPSGLDAPSGRYKYDPQPDLNRELENWKFQAKQNKIAEVGQLLGRPSAPLSHFVVAAEVESLGAAERLFDSGVLAGKYRTYLVTGNDSRAIDIAFAVRADLDVTVEMETHRDVKWYDPVEQERAHLFTRDVPALIVRDGITKKIQFVLLGIHYKSMRDRADGLDPKSEILRAAQVKATAEIVRNYQRRFGPDVKIILAGDHNMDTRTAKEMEPLKEVLVDGFDALEVPVGARTTHTYHPLEGSTVETQLDTFMVSDSVRPFLLEATVLAEHHHETGELLPNPTSFEDREANYPSDHRAISLVVSGKLFR